MVAESAAGTICAGATVAATPLAALRHRVVAKRLHLFPLVGRELGADGEQEAGVGFFKLGAGLGDFVNLGICSRMRGFRQEYLSSCFFESKDDCQYVLSRF